MSYSPTSTRRLLPDGLRVSHMDARDRPLVLLVEPVSTTARCPLCGSKSARIHSRYPRTLADLPWRGIAVTFKVHARKFFCENEGCERTIFCERLPDVAAYARKTGRLEETLLSIAFELGGEAGARLARELGLLVSPDALLGRIRWAAPAPDKDAVRVLGVDDFAFRRGHRYGTILVDLERRRPVDVLPDRTVPTVRGWLDEHPGIEVVCRDRYSPYIEAIDQALPEAKQVTDRWHLLKNLSEAVERFVDRHRSLVEQAAASVSGLQMIEHSLAKSPTAMLYSKEEGEKQLRRHNRYERYLKVVELHRQGLSERAIARALSINRATVRKFLHSDGFPERAATKEKAVSSIPTYRTYTADGPRAARMPTSSGVSYRPEVTKAGWQWSADI